MRELDVIFGGEKKLAACLCELAGRYHPPAIFVYSTCIVGIIGDDLSSVCRRASQDLGIPVLPVKSEGFRGNKNEGYKAACNALAELIGSSDYVPEKPSLNLLGEYNVADDLSYVKPFFQEMGLEVIATLTGDARVAEIQRAHAAQLNLVQCSGSMTYLAKKMEEKYSIPYRRVSFFGLQDMSNALLTAAQFFGVQQMQDKAEQIIFRETARVMPAIQACRARVTGKKAAIYMGGAAKAVSLVRAFQDLGMEVVIIGTQTGSRDDYQNIAYIVKDGTVIIDDANPLELSELLVRQKADLLVAGVKERFLAYKMGIAFCDFNHDRTVNFEGYEGMKNFAREICLTISSPVWQLPIKRASSIGKRINLKCSTEVSSSDIQEPCYS
jgi:nitrogenase molybdenum-cofactor synthesis protein NifE